MRLRTAAATVFATAILLGGAASTASAGEINGKGLPVGGQGLGAAQANSICACDVIRRAGDEKRARCLDVQRLEREPIRLWPWLVRARHLSGSDDVKGDTNLGRSPPTNLV